MYTGLIITSAIGLIIFIMGIIIIIGKGDRLIAGYNTADEEEKQKYNIKRVRICIGGLSVIMAPLIVLFEGNQMLLFTFTFPLIFLAIALSNTWEKKK